MRFAHFVRRPGAIRALLQGRWRGVGHNPLVRCRCWRCSACSPSRCPYGALPTTTLFSTGRSTHLSTGTQRLASSGRTISRMVHHGLVARTSRPFYYVRFRADDIVNSMITGEKAINEPGSNRRGGGGVSLRSGAEYRCGRRLGFRGDRFRRLPPVETPSW